MNFGMVCRFALVGAAGAALGACATETDTTNPIDPADAGESTGSDDPADAGDSSTETKIFETGYPSSGADFLRSIGDVPGCGLYPFEPRPQFPLGGRPREVQHRSTAQHVEEADLVHRVNDRLYSLGASGLTVLDVTNFDAPRTLGTYRPLASTFNMYLRGDVALVLYNGFVEYEYDDEQERWNARLSNTVVALDVSDPGAITELRRSSVTGRILDSRLVGDVLHVLTSESQLCSSAWNSNRLTSLDVRDPSRIEQVDSIRNDDDSRPWLDCISATDERVYLLTPPAQNIGGASRVQVVDISNREGVLVEGARLEIDGALDTCWQLDEHAGVLRVLSSPDLWNRNQNNVAAAHSFSIDSSAELTPLGHAALRLEFDEELGVVRFDGDRAFATDEWGGRLLVVDFTNPEEPRHAGELDWEGRGSWIHAAGERLLGLVHDGGEGGGPVRAVLLDTSDSEQLTLLSETTFEGSIGIPWPHTDYDVRIEENSILMPFWGRVEANEASDTVGRGTYTSGIQLLDWQRANDVLVARGVAPMQGQTRRAFGRGDRLFALGETVTRSFDLSERDTPSVVSTTVFEESLDRSLIAGDSVVRLSRGIATWIPRLTVSSIANAERPEAASAIDLPQVTEEKWISHLHAAGERVHLVYETEEYGEEDDVLRARTRFVTVDVSNPEQPVVEADADLGLGPEYRHGSAAHGSHVVNIGSTLVFASYERPDHDTARLLRVADLSDPAAPHVTALTMPEAKGYTGLLSSDDWVITSYYQPSESDPERFRYSLQRIDVSDPREPLLLPPVSIPGALLAFDAAASRAFTIDYGTTPAGAPQHTLHLVAVRNDRTTILESHELPPGELVGKTVATPERLFLTLYASSSAEANDVELTSYGYSFSDGPFPVLVLSGLSEGELQLGRIEIPVGDARTLTKLAASGHHAVLSSGFRERLSVLDATDPHQPRLAEQVKLAGSVSDLQVSNGVVVASLGQRGVHVIALE